MLWWLWELTWGLISCVTPIPAIGGLLQGCALSPSCMYYTEPTSPIISLSESALTSGVKGGLLQSEGQGHCKCREQEIYFGHQILHNWKGTCKKKVRNETGGRENEPATKQTGWEHIQPGNTRAGWGTLCSMRLPLWVLSNYLVLSPSLWLVSRVGSGEEGLDEERTRATRPVGRLITTSD